jgi:hypothetical protein
MSEFIAVGVICLRHYLSDRVPYATADVQPVAFCVTTLTVPCNLCKPQAEMLDHRDAREVGKLNSVLE